ncbi:cell wall protein IFF6-like [Pecten maximus]|uniref:cell wall protein IFF6-like n=1 Tax=Pecten maximus TaxID=6579 RepID=UPI00145887A1|nr:cell wall protein IFF6-like [Pecten maximus]
MVKCQGLNEDRGPCGLDLQEAARFCPECGTPVPKRTVLEKPKDTVPCPGTYEGNPCSNTELTHGQRFCVFCGWKVNQSIFEPGSIVCGADRGETRCTGIIKKNETTCPICESEKGVAPPTIQKDQVNPDNGKSVIQSQSGHGKSTLKREQSEKESVENPATAQSANDKPGTPFQWSESDRDGAVLPPKIPRHTEGKESDCKEVDIEIDESNVRSSLENQTLLGPEISQQFTGQKSQTSAAKLKFIYGEGAEGSTGIDRNKLQQGETSDDTTQLPNQRDNTGSTGTGQQLPEGQGNTSEPPRSKIKILYGNEDNKVAPGAQSTSENDSYTPTQTSRRFQANIKILQNNEKSGESPCEKSEKSNGNKPYQGDTWEPTYSITGDQTNMLSAQTFTRDVVSDVTTKSASSPEDITARGDGPAPEPMSIQESGTDAASALPSHAVQLPPENDSSKTTARGDGPAPEPMPIQESGTDTASGLSHPVQHTPENDISKTTARGDEPAPEARSIQESRTDTASAPPSHPVQHPPENDSTQVSKSQKGIFNFIGGSRQKTNNDVWQSPDMRFGNESKSDEIKDAQLFGDNSSSSTETSDISKSITKASTPSSLFSLSQKSTNDSVHTSPVETDMDIDTHLQNQSAASAVSMSDKESESSNEDDDENSLNQNEESQKKKLKDKKTGGAKSKRGKKKERKRRKEEEKKKEKTDVPDKKGKGQKHMAGSTSGRENDSKGDANSTNIGTDVDQRSVSNLNKADASSSSKMSDSVSSNASNNRRSNARTHCNNVKVVFHAVFSAFNSE